MRKLFALIFIFMFLISFTSAFDFDNVLKYEDNDMKAIIRNCDVWLFGCLNEGETIVEAELKSHSSPTEIRNIIRGEDRLVMFYDFNNFKEDKLGEVIFKDIKTGEEVERDYYFAKAIYEDIEVEDWGEVCSEKILNDTLKQVCKNEVIDTHLENKIVRWEKLDNIDLKVGKYRIGLFTDVLINDHIDGIWTIAGKKVEKHSEWTDSLNVDLVSHYKLDDTAGDATDSLGINNGTSTGITYEKGGKINESFGFEGSGDKVVATYSSPVNASWSVTGWVNVTTLNDLNYMISFNDGGFSNGIYLNNLDQIGWYNGGANLQLSKVVTVNKWYFVALTKANVTYTLYGAAEDGSITSTSAIQTDVNSTSLVLGNRGDADWPLFGDIDEVGLWTRELSATEVTQLFNSGTGISYIPSVVLPVITQISPEDDILIINNNLTFKGNATLDTGIYNISLFINENRNYTIYNTSSTETPLSFEYNLTNIEDGEYNWTLKACGINICSITGNYSFIINTVPNITLQNPTPIQNLNTTNNDFQINVSLTERYFENVTFRLFNSTQAIVNTTTFTDDTRIINYSGLSDGTYYYNVTVSTNTSQQNTTETRTINIDTTIPTINSIYPNETINYHILGDNLTLNYSVTDSNFEKAIFSYNNTNYSFTGTINSSTFKPESGKNNGTWYFNDTFGNLLTSVMRWSYNLIQNNVTYNSEAIELSQETFILNFSYTPSLWTSISGNLNYDATNYSSTISGSGDSRLFTNTLTIPSVASGQNKTFNWNIRLTNSSGEFFINTNDYNQTIVNIGVDNCSTYGTRLYNLTLRDEEKQNLILGDIEIELEITGIETSNDRVNFSTSFTNVTNGSVCISTNLTSQNLYLDTTIKYSATGFQQEYYNIQKYLLNTSSKTQAITLYDLNSSSATIFDILYKGSNFIAVSDAIIIITKKFISEGIFKTVEIPLTDIDGKTTASLEKDSEIYTFNVYKDGTFLSTFQNVIPTCQNDLTGDCSINLNEVSSPDSVYDFTTLDDLNYQVTWDEDTKTIDLVYSTSTGESNEINLLVQKLDQYENDTICDDSVTASSGSLSCIVPLSYTNQTVIIKLYKDNSFVSLYTISLEQNPSDYFGATGYFLAFLIFITIPLMFITSLVGVVIGMVIGVVMLSLLFLSSDASIYSLTGGIIWFLVAALILLWKLNDGERR